MDHTITIPGMTFSPRDITVAVGDTICWTNEGRAVPHTATSDVGSPFHFHTGHIAPGSFSAEIPFTEVGTFPYHDNYHWTLHGTVTVVDRSPYAVVGVDD